VEREESGQAPPRLNGFDPKMDRTSPGQVVTQVGNTKEMLVHILQYTIGRTNVAAQRRLPAQTDTRGESETGGERSAGGVR